MSGFAVLLTIAVAVVSAPASPACACSCVPPEPTPAFADLIFDGVVLDVAGPPPRRGGDSRVRFAVDTLVRGVAGSEVELTTSSSSASCGYEFLVGRRYRVNAHDGTTGLCSSNRLLPPVATPTATPTASPTGSPAGPPGGQPSPPGGPADPGPARTSRIDLGDRVSASTPSAGWLLAGVGGGLVGVAGLVSYLLLRRRRARPSG